MRSSVRWVGVVCILALAPGCDTTQPQQVGVQSMQIRMNATSLVDVYNVWEEYYDADQDGVPDPYDPSGNLLDPPVQVVCQLTTQQASAPVPWPYSLEISVLRAGETVPEVVTSQDALDSDFNLTPYASGTFGAQPNPPCPSPKVCNPLGQLAATDRLVIDSPFSDPNRDPANPNRYRCPGAPGLGDPRMGGTTNAPLPPPFTIDVGKGDTVIVKARKALRPLNGVEVLIEPRLTAQTFLGGRLVAPAGKTSSSEDPGSGVSFSFTVK